jgi:hypothetical protein
LSSFTAVAFTALALSGCSDPPLTEYDVGSVRVSYPKQWKASTISPTEAVFERRSGEWQGHPLGEQLTVTRLTKTESAKPVFDSSGGSHVWSFSVTAKSRGYRFLLEHHCGTDGCSRPRTRTRIRGRRRTRIRRRTRSPTPDARPRVLAELRAARASSIDYCIHNASE